jgi:AAA+ ATPase superfamily predicted ATPase
LKFYGRETQIAELKQQQKLSFDNHACLTVVTGRRRVGKSRLLKQAFSAKNTVYLFVAKKNEALLCSDFRETIYSSIGLFVAQEINSFTSIFQTLLEASKTKEFNVVIDEFQEFEKVNKSIFSDIQKLWDQYRLESHMNLVVCGSAYTLMHKIFQDQKEPLFGRADAMLRVKPFDVLTQKTILADAKPNYKNDDLLAIYAVTGGVAKYIELLIDNNATSYQEMVDYMVREDSLFLEEGQNLLIGEFGKNYLGYFSVLSAISNGINQQNTIENVLGGMSVGGQLKRLIEDYDIIQRKRPLLAKPNTQAVRYEIIDNFTQYWFNYFDRNQSLIEIGNFAEIKKRLLNDYESYSGFILERYFKQKMAESQKYQAIGSWWEPKREQFAIDILALPLEKNTAEVVEVKRQKKKFQPEQLREKSLHLQRKVLQGFDVAEYCLSIEDM